MKRSLKWVGFLVVCVLSGLLLCSAAYAARQEQVLPLRYKNTQSVLASLSIKGSTATCYGRVTPQGTQDCSLSLTLYRKNGSRWVAVQTWTQSAQQGASASLNKTKTIGAGTYKVTAVGNVDGEVVSVDSAEKTK